MSDEEIKVTVRKREECTLVPEGISCTETKVAFYLRVRRNNMIRLVRVRKKDLEIFTDLEKL